MLRDLLWWSGVLAMRMVERRWRRSRRVTGGYSPMLVLAAPTGRCTGLVNRVCSWGCLRWIRCLSPPALAAYLMRAGRCTLAASCVGSQGCRVGNRCTSSVWSLTGSWPLVSRCVVTPFFPAWVRLSIYLAAAEVVEVWFHAPLTCGSSLAVLCVIAPLVAFVALMEAPWVACGWHPCPAGLGTSLACPPSRLYFTG